MTFAYGSNGYLFYAYNLLGLVKKLYVRVKIDEKCTFCWLMCRCHWGQPYLPRQLGPGLLPVHCVHWRICQHLTGSAHRQPIRMLL
jgi:hypothetical protein